MKSHDPKRIIYASARQFWRAFVYVLQVHENQIIKRAGVAGIRARAQGFDCACGAKSPGRGGPVLIHLMRKGHKKSAPAECCGGAQVRGG